MRPDCHTILDSVIASLETYVLPKVEDDFAISILKTTGNLLRHVQIRIAEEPALLHEDLNDLMETLADIHARVRGAPELQEALGLSDLSDTRDGPDGQFVGLDVLQLRWDASNHDLDVILQRLSAVRARFAGDEAYLSIRTAIRAYLARHLNREERLISPAFTGGRR